MQPGGETSLPLVGATDDTQRGNSVAPGGGKATSIRRGKGGSAKEDIQKRSDQKDDSNRMSLVGHKEVRALTYSPYIAGIILDYSRELGDTAHGPANVTHALRLWRDSTLTEGPFVDLLHAARQRVRLYQGKQGLGTNDNKMAYFFRVVTDLAHLPEQESPLC